LADIRAARTSLASQYLAQYFKFGTVGLSATLVHVLIFVTMIEILAIRPLLSNLLAFSVAVSVSFAGHFHWTFRPGSVERRGRSKAEALMKFFFIAFLGLVLNSITVYFLIDIFALPYVYALFVMTIIVPIIIFLLSKHWAFA
jgi:putative flippase GtrA